MACADWIRLAADGVIGVLEEARLEACWDEDTLLMFICGFHRAELPDSISLRLSPQKV